MFYLRGADCRGLVRFGCESWGRVMYGGMVIP